MLLFSFCLFLIAHSYTSSVQALNCGDLFLTVNAASNKLEINWDFTRNCNNNRPELINLVINTDESKTILQTISVRSSPKGYQLSETKFESLSFPGNWNANDQDPPNLSSVCYPYSVESLYHGEIVDNVCLKIEPTWMENFGQLRLGAMIIPGTHDSGVGKWSGATEGLTGRYTFTQELNIWGQLVSGIRYLDVGVGYFVNLNPKIWINGGLKYCTRMREELQHIANFLDKSPKEVVILHINSFEYPATFLEGYHTEVLNLIESVLGGYTLARLISSDPFGPALEEIWDGDPKRRLIVSYNNEQLVEATPWLWHNIKYKTESTTKGLDLYNYLNTIKSDHDHPNTPFCVLSATLTPNLEYIIRYPDRSLKYMADEVNPDVSAWLKSDGWSEQVNIIATDFFTGTDIVNIAIEANLNKLSNKENII